ncbi:MAG: quinone-dependent dihydroorotate dehydrogenase [Hyphomicrobiales bacterium]
MNFDTYRLVRPVFFALPPERAHGLSLWALRLGLGPRRAAATDDGPILAQRVFGLNFTNPVGLAAGYDKNAVATKALSGLGFGFVEVGTVTPRPQQGNPGPRLFRLIEHGAIINRLGFNNAGQPAMRRRLNARAEPNAHRPGIVGVNIGANRDSTDPIEDYANGLAAMMPVADYITVNISSPNTPGLRDLQARKNITALLKRLSDTRAGALANGAPNVPILVKIAPDLDQPALADIVEAAVDAGMDGLIVANTTTARPGLGGRMAGLAGGLSGRPLFAPSTALLAQAFLLARGRLALVGVGGICSGADALVKIKAGASLVQLYTGLVFAGPGLVTRVLADLAAALRAEGFAGIGDVVGVDAPRLARRLANI